MLLREPRELRLNRKNEAGSQAEQLGTDAERSGEKRGPDGSRERLQEASFLHRSEGSSLLPEGAF